MLVTGVHREKDDPMRCIETRQTGSRLKISISGKKWWVFNNIDLAKVQEVRDEYLSLQPGDKKAWANAVFSDVSDDSPAAERGLKHFEHNAIRRHDHPMRFIRTNKPAAGGPATSYTLRIQFENGEKANVCNNIDLPKMQEIRDEYLSLQPARTKGMG